jgi:hypothetical protein
MLALVAALLAVTASAASAGPVWRVWGLANTTAAPGGTLDFIVEAHNVGDATADPAAEPIAFSGTLPAGLRVHSVDPGNGNFDCSGVVAGSQRFACQGNALPAGPEGHQRLDVVADVDPGAVLGSLLTGSFTITGGGAPAASTVASSTVSNTLPGFGIAAFDAQVTADDAGTPFSQAGGHPFESTTHIDFNTFRHPDPIKGDLTPVEATKDVTVELPEGFYADPSTAGRCSLTQLARTEGISPAPLCSSDSQVGTTIILSNSFAGGSFVFGPVPVFNMEPPVDAPARLGFNVAGTVVTLDIAIRSTSDYGITAHVRNISEGLAIASTSVTLWGVPSDPVHTPERSCSGGGTGCSSGTARAAYLRYPTSCSQPGIGLPTRASADSWVHPGVFSSTTSFSHLDPGYPSPPSMWGSQLATTGCAKVPFDPDLSVIPDTTAAGAPTGIGVDVRLPQSSDPGTIDQSDLRKAVVRLPKGMRVNPSSASGLQGCTPDQIALHTETPEHCPGASKLGSVSVKVPALQDPLQGSVYLASPHENPFGSLIAVYIVASGSGVTVKLSGRIDLDPLTGQITTTVDDNPQAPFSDVHLQFKDGPRAPLVNPTACGSYTTQGEFTSWSGKIVNTSSALTTNSCTTPRFSPGFTAGTQNPIAGGFSPFGMQLTRTDDDGEFSSLSSLSLPKGLLANVSSITTRCTIEQADAHACPADSHIGEVTTGAGAGTNPFYVGGDVYLTGPYEGNPFGIAVIVHALAGPFDLGYVVVKGAIQIHDDGSVSVATDPFPTILQGIPLQIRDIRVNLDRSGFTFNPTNCNPMSINGTVQSTANQVAGVSSRFQVGECANLAFKPKFSASTAGKTSKANGASFHVHLASNEGPHNTGGAGESDIAKVDVQLPVSLPARLTTLQKACTAAQFASDPAGCPAASFVGSATAHTPILASPLSGPAILVSHGGQAFPDLVLVLQGEGVRLNLTGHTQIKKGITFSHFETVPDAPVASFDLTLPQGPHSALTTDVPGRNLCANTRTVTVTKRVTRRVHGHNRKVTVKAKKAVSASLLMPTTLTAQNGAVIHQNTKIAVTGCAAPKAKAKKARRAKRHG